VFGDSLSDNGNLAEAFYRQNFPNPPSYHDSFTNGPVAAQVLASRLGLTLNPSLFLTGFQDVFGLFGGASYVAGTNYAVAGATAAAAPAFGGIPGANLPQQVAAYSAHVGGIADPNALYFVLSGGNDVRQAALNNLGAVGISAGVNNEISSIQLLINAGARNIMVVNVPNVGVIPEFAQDNATKAAAATSLSQQYDTSLSNGLAGLTRPAGTLVNLFDLYAFNSDIIANASAYGITDTTDRCFTNTPLTPTATAACGVNGANIGQYFYWDSIHPTGQVQALAGNAIAAALGVPEPSTSLLLGAGVLALVCGARRRKTA
ncbi:MAG: SGNH/GDSL hydrolase family protein, partial [Burkholderiaceae bacterium]